MEELEQKKRLIRLRAPQSKAEAVKSGTIVDAPVYVSDSQYGPHMLLCVGVNQQIPELSIHPDAEEFLLINDGRPTKPLLLLISMLSAAELEAKAALGMLFEEDLIAMELVFNDPAVSFFTMLPGVPHGEAVMDEEGETPYFFVTQGRDLPAKEMNLSGLALRVSRDR
jgi:hypothetical protein